MTAASVSPSAAIPKESRAGRLLRPVLIALWLTVAGGALVHGLEYYRLPLTERAFSPLYEAYKPGGSEGHLYGIVGTAMMAIGVAMYSLRKRVTTFQRLGKLKYWLEVHIFLCTLGPFLVLLHTAFRFGGIVAIAFWSMAIVVGSGVFGRYLYVRIPKSINGRFLSLKTINEQKRELVSAFAARAKMSEDDVQTLLPRRAPRAAPGVLRAIVLAPAFDVSRRRELRRVRSALSRRGVRPQDREALSALLDEEIRLEQQTILLTPFQRLFGYWHVLHLPLALLMLFIVIIHIGVAIAFGYGLH